MKHTINLLLIVLLFSCTKKKDDPIPQSTVSLNKISQENIECNGKTAYTDTTFYWEKLCDQMANNCRDHVFRNRFKVTETCDSVSILYTNNVTVKVFISKEPGWHFPSDSFNVWRHGDNSVTYCIGSSWLPIKSKIYK